MKTLAQYFDAVYLINLPERKDRLRSAMEQLRKVGWDVPPTPIQLIPGIQFPEPSGFPSAGAKGAYHSHWKCLKCARSENHSKVLILEDDIAISPSIPARTEAIKDKLRGLQWDLIFFGHEATGNIPRAKTGRVTDALRFEAYSTDIQGLHFYAVNGRIFNRLLAHLEGLANGPAGDQLAGPMPIDGALNVFRRTNPDVRTLIAWPKLGWQRPSRSDITPRRLDDILFLRPMLAALRELKHKINSRLS